MSNQFKVGDVVSLKSEVPDGPRMTVHSIWPEGDVECVWFDHESRQYQYKEFNPQTLEANP